MQHNILRHKFPFMHNIVLETQIYISRHEVVSHDKFDVRDNSLSGHDLPISVISWYRDLWIN